MIEISSIEITNLKKTYDFVKELSISESEPLLKEDLIKNIHKLITKNIEYKYNDPGSYRNNIVKVGDKRHGGVYTPPKCLPDIRNLMGEYIDWINSEDILSLEPTIRAALAHYYLGLIHPFADGNGRTARIIEALLLKLSGIKYIPAMLSNFYYQNPDEYFITFSITRRDKAHDVTHFLKFVLKGCIDSLNYIKRKITFYIRKSILRDYYDLLEKNRSINSRQNSLLIFLLEQNEQYYFVFNELFDRHPLKSIYSNVGHRTARRDLAKLKTMNLLTVSKNKYILNRRALDAR